MYTNTTTEFDEKILSDGRTFRAKIICDGVETTDGIITAKISQISGNDTQSVSIGSSSSSQLDITMVKPDVSFTGKEFEFQIGLYTDDNMEVLEWIPMGFYTAQEPTISRNTITFTSYDRMTTKLSGNYVTSLEFPCDIQDVCDEIETLTGITIKNKPNGITVTKRIESVEPGEDPNDDGEDDGEDDGDKPIYWPTAKITYCDPFNGCTFRESVAMIAGVMSAFATFNRHGILEFKTFKKANTGEGRDFYLDDDGNYLTDLSGSWLYGIGGTYLLGCERTFDDINVAEYSYKIGYIESVYNAMTSFIMGDITQTGVKMTNYVMREPVLMRTLSELQKIVYRPATLSCMGDLRLELGDIITVENFDGELFSLPIMGLNFDFDGGLKCELSSYGSTSESNEAYVSPTQAQIDKVTDTITFVQDIATQRITADRIDINGVFAKDITATGTITGATLKGSSGEFTKGFNVKIPYNDDNDFNLSAKDTGIDFGIINNNTDPEIDPSTLDLTNEAYFSMTGGRIYGSGYNEVMFTTPSTSSHIRFNCGGSEIVDITPDGVVVDKNLTVNGEADFNGRITSRNNYGFYGYTTTGGKLQILYVSSNNRVGIGNNSYATVLMGSSVKLNSSSGATVTSDKRLKKNIKSIDDKYEQFFDSLNPVSYKYKAKLSGHKSGRTHLGYIAQEVKEGLEDSGLDTSDFGGYIDMDMDGKELGLIYSEFIALNTHMIQKLRKENKDLKNELEELKKEVDNIKQNL